MVEAVSTIHGTTALVTGAAGFVGSHLVRALRARGARVRALDAAPMEFDDPQVEAVRGDLCDPSVVAAAVDGVDVIFHTAAIIELAERAPKAVRDKVWAVNVDATRRLLELAERAGVSRFVHTSSTATVLAEGAAGGDETIAYSSAKDLYTTSKVESEKLVRAHRGRMLTVAIRPGGIYGPGERKQLVGPSFAAFAKGEPVTIIGEGTTRLDYTHVDNLVDGQIRAAERLFDGSPVCGAAYFITDDQPMNHGEFTRRLVHYLGLVPKVRYLSLSVLRPLATASEIAFERFGKKPLISHMQLRTCSIDYYYSIAAARRDLGYAPLFDTDAGIRSMVPDIQGFMKSTEFRGH